MSNSKLLAAVLSGAAAGALLGVLLAPKSGSETRKQILKSGRKSYDAVDQLIEDGKKTWYETKGKAEKNVGVAADELDDFMRHIINKGQSLWNKAKNKSSKIVDDSEEMLETATSNGKKAAHNIKDSVS
jgi:gas vesicle protein